MLKTLQASGFLQHFLCKTLFSNYSAQVKTLSEIQLSKRGYHLNILGEKCYTWVLQGKKKANWFKVSKEPRWVTILQKFQILLFLHTVHSIDFKQNKTVGLDLMLTFQTCTQILQLNPQLHNRKQMLIIPSFLEWWHIALTPLFPLHWSLLFLMAAPYRRVCQVQNIYQHKCKQFTEPRSVWDQSAPGLPPSQSIWRENVQICCFRRNLL